LLELNAEWARDIAERCSEAELVKKMRHSGMNSLLDDAIEKLITGDTSYSEVIQIVSSW
jgi:type IV pilus assembly protein PilB